MTLPRLSLLTAFVVALASGAAPPEPEDTCGGRPCIQVGTFNLYWLGSDNRFGNPGLRSRADVERLADLVAEELDIEVIAFQEVNVAIVETRGVQTVKSPQQWLWLKEALKQRGYRFLVGESGLALRLVIAWDSDEVRLTDSAALQTSTSVDFGDGCSTSNQRSPIAARLRSGELEFWLVTLHMKSKINGVCGDRIRDRQARELVKAVHRQLGARRGHVVLAGDFNAFGNEASIVALRRKGKFRAFTGRSQRAPGSGDASYLIPPFRSVIDHVMLRPRDSRKSWVRKSTVIFDPLTAGAEFAAFPADYSDHAPVFTSFYTDRR